MHHFHHIYFAVDPSWLTPKLRRLDPESWLRNTWQTVEWDMSDIGDFTLAETHRIDAFSVNVGYKTYSGRQRSERSSIRQKVKSRKAISLLVPQNISI